MNTDDDANKLTSAVEQAGLAAAEAGAAEVSAQHAEDSARDAQIAVRKMEVAAAEEKASIEIFELCTAILLACGAICAGLAGYQNGIWNGNAVAQYTGASIQTTKAASSAAMANALIGHDLHVYIEAKRIVWQGLLSKKDSPERDVYMHQAGLLLLHELGPDAYTDLRLPSEAERAAKVVGSDDIPEGDLAKLTQSVLSPEYYDAMYRDGNAQNAKAQEMISLASVTSQMGDRYSLASVFYTVSLALAGIGLVFKTRVRWSFFAVGLTTFVFSTIYMSRLHWG